MINHSKALAARSSRGDELRMSSSGAAALFRFVARAPPLGRLILDAAWFMSRAALRLART